MIHESVVMKILLQIVERPGVVNSSMENMYSSRKMKQKYPHNINKNIHTW